MCWALLIMEGEKVVHEIETTAEGGGAYGTVTIHCSWCKRMIYQKDFDKR
jgi:hypothetical protein